MSDNSSGTAQSQPGETETSHNLPVFTVSEISQAVKHTVEETFQWVRIRGEISGFKRAASGHLYFALKDADAVIDGVCWRGTAGRLAIKPEDGMEIVATGRLTTYPGRSKYQVVVDHMELAGEGALLKLLEDRRRKLESQGLFAPERKRDIPYLPDVIGVVTSPTGAVIRDILHRLADRFPVHVLIWPVLVQGENAAAQVAAAVQGFGAIEPGGPVPRPDVVIVARGGGSLEDLWAFNEE
ncbi:MAG: exodeoxyribonuclease VII large subunit, partial [Rhodospirillales bacterium]